MCIDREVGRFDIQSMHGANPRFDRREFLLALSAGVPLSALGCDDAESGQLRATDPDSDIAAPLEPLAALSSQVDVDRAVSSQTLLVADEQACSVGKSLAVAVGDQIRVRRNASEYALYTVEQKRAQDPAHRVRMGLDARLRLGTSSEFSAALSVPVVAPGLTDQEAQAASEFVERLLDDGSNTGLVVIAPHGGTIEIATDRQAEAMTVALGCSSWICKGWSVGGGSYERWHITSTKLSPNSFPGLGQIADRGFTHAVAFHGMASGGVLIGGAAPLEIKLMLRAAILDALSDESIAVDIATVADAFNADSPSNVVNWLTGDGLGGVQIEQGVAVRIDHWQEVVDGVIAVFEQLI
jgi:phage replication-related protein YjqB (UPF0714/DUF867 family)